MILKVKTDIKSMTYRFYDLIGCVTIGRADVKDDEVFYRDVKADVNARWPLAEYTGDGKKMYYASFLYRGVEFSILFDEGYLLNDQGKTIEVYN